MTGYYFLQDLCPVFVHTCIIVLMTDVHEVVEGSPFYYYKKSGMVLQKLRVYYIVGTRKTNVYVSCFFYFLLLHKL